MVEWAVIAFVMVIFLSGFFSLVLPKIQMHNAKAGIEAALLDRVSISPPQLAVVNGAGNLTNGVSLLNETNLDRFNFEAYNFLRSVALSAGQAAEAYGLNPADFTYCLGLGFKDELLTETVAGTEVPLTRSSTGLGVSCPSTFYPILDSAEAKQWVGISPVVNVAYAESPTLGYFIVLAALGTGEVCTTSDTCKAGNTIVGSPNALLAPDSEYTPADTPTPTPIPTDTPTPIPTDTATPEPTATNTPTPTLAGDGGTPIPPPTDTPVMGS